MARPEKQRPSSLDEAVAALKRDPTNPVRAEVENLEVELRVVGKQQPTRRRGSRMAALGPWEGITTDDLMRILREGRAAGGAGEPPKF